MRVHKELHGQLTKTSACCRHGDIDISGKRTLQMKLFYRLLCYFGLWVFTQPAESLGVFLLNVFPLFSPLSPNKSWEMLMTSVSSSLCSDARCASKTDSPASPKMSLWIIKRRICLSPQINRWRKEKGMGAALMLTGRSFIQMSLFARSHS